ncbi:peptidase family M1-domain-containing protein [Amylocarpus encephaloides]|uniref:Aminopeptidase n=1 Tax=Amylocarpus encephaloides TaxID=45428 RepID=A0A9P8C793_9HELO|nr:peptidase family M1-domain-containing protein [Amylocarpus encephaloides]
MREFLLPSLLPMRVLSSPVIRATIFSSALILHPVLFLGSLSPGKKAFSNSGASCSPRRHSFQPSLSRADFHQPRTSPFRHAPSIASSIRHCSYRRHNMCKFHGEQDVSGASADVTKGREILPGNVVPKHYDITLEPDFKALTYEGTIVLDLDVVEDSTSISLNTLELDIHSTKILAGSETISSSPTLAYDESKQTTKVTFEKTLSKGTKAQMEMKFTGQLNDKMAGFYRSTYKNKDGSEGTLATTQLEATDARRAFPCFDEPSLKAEFTITLIADKDLTCLSNMDVASESEVQSETSGSIKKVVKFNRSPRMSTYLVAFIIGELNYIETDKFRLPVRVYAPPNQDIEHGRFSLELAAQTLAFYEKTFDSEFPLPKMDMVAIPDFAAGAMENWGLITYRVVDVLFDEKTSGASTKERVAEVVQHELAHQWFGNLVTMDFWDGLWLNEGFATWMSWYSCNIFFPEWKVWQNYVTDTLQGALSLDSLRSSHPIEVPVKRADEVNQIFDAISYSKGSCVLRMISKHLGEEVFMEGIRQYLKKHAYGNTQTGDLWAALGKVSGQNLEETMNIWTRHVGYPVVSVTENESDNTVHVKQNRFLRTADVKPEEDEVLYPVFLGVRTHDGVDEDLVLSKREDSFRVKDLDFFKLNADHSGIYRTSYTPARLEKLGQAARDGLLSVEDRAGMIADAGALAASGYQKTSGVLNLLKGFDSEKEFVVWNEIVSRLGAIQGAWMFEDKKVRDGIESFQRDLVSEKAHEAGWEFKESDDHIEQQFKAMLFGSAGMSGDAVVKKAAKEMFTKFAAGDKSAIHPNIRGSVFGMALKYGGKDEYEVILNTYRESRNADERNTALRCLGRAKDPGLIQRTIALPFSGEVKEQDVYLPISALRTHPEGIEALYNWMTENFDILEKKFPAGLSMLGSIVGICTSSFTSKAALDRIHKFFESRSTKGFDQSLAQASDNIRAKDAWLGRDRQDVKDWVEAYQVKNIKSEL